MTVWIVAAVILVIGLIASFLMKDKERDAPENSGSTPPRRPESAWSKNPNPSLDDLVFDTSELQLVEEEPNGIFEPGTLGEHGRAWTSADNDLVILKLVKDPPADASGKGNIDQYFAALRAEWANRGFRVMEMHKIDSALIRGFVCTMVRAEDERPIEHATNIGILFATHAYSFFIRCPEQGPSGFRESQVAMKSLQAAGELDDLDPYDEKYDELVPSHSLSRARRLSEHVYSSIRFKSDAVERFQPFPWSEGES